MTAITGTDSIPLSEIVTVNSLISQEVFVLTSIVLLFYVCFLQV